MAVLNGNPEGFVHWLGIKCSSWVSTSRGSTARSKANPLGREELDSVAGANCMVSRPAMGFFNWSIQG